MHAMCSFTSSQARAQCTVHSCTAIYLAGDVAVKVEKGREVLQLLTNDEAQSGKHGHTAVGDLRLTPAAHIG